MPVTANPNTNRWLPVRPEPADGSATALRVFCLPHAGGAASSYRAWVRARTPGTDIRPVQLPGRESRIAEPFPTSIPELARTLAEVLLPHLDVPYALVGNSMGALTAFETALVLQERYGLPPVHLVAAATRPPGTRPRGLAAVSALADEEFIDAMQHRHGGIPAGILGAPDLLAAFLPALRADMAMFESYRPSCGTRLTCPVTAAVGTADPGLGKHELAGWGTFTTGAFACVELPGDHFALLSHPGRVLEPIHREAALVQPVAASRPSAGHPERGAA